MSQQRQQPLNLVYVLWRFPVISETFILNEMVYLRKHLPEMNFTVYSIKKPHDSKAHKQAQKFIHDDLYIPPLSNLKFLLTVLAYMIRRPLKSTSVLFKLIRETPVNISIRLSLYYLLQAHYCFIHGVFLAAKFKNQTVDHLHTHYSESSALIIRTASALTGIPYSLTMHAHDIFQNPNKVLIVNLIKNSRFSVTISDYNRRYLTSLDNSIRDKINIIHCGVNMDRFKPQQRKHNEVVKLFTVARLVETKGVKETIQALSQLPSHIKFVYHIIGAGPEYDELDALIKEKGLQDKIYLLGAKTQEEVLQFMQDSDLFVLFCKVAKNGNMDGIPVALMEAMAMKLPVISTRISGIPELIKDGSGVIVEENDEQGYTENIYKLCQLSPTEREKMGAKGRQIVAEEFNLDREVAKLAALFSGDQQSH